MDLQRQGMGGLTKCRGRCKMKKGKGDVGDAVLQNKGRRKGCDWRCSRWQS